MRMPPRPPAKITLAHDSPIGSPARGDELHLPSEGIATEAPGWTEKSRVKEGHAPAPRPSDDHPTSRPANITPPPLHMAHEDAQPARKSPPKDMIPRSMADGLGSAARQRLRNPWAMSRYTLLTTVVGFAALFLMVQSFMTRQLDVKGCDMSYMRPSYHKFDEFDTEHTRFATKYSLYLYREGGIDDDFAVGLPHVLHHAKTDSV
jgi:glycosylphosphatidylinositol deacylase